LALAKTWTENEQGIRAQNFSLLDCIALNMLKQETTVKRGIQDKKLKAAWNHP
jgi:hypothetical protein